MDIRQETNGTFVAHSLHYCGTSHYYGTIMVLFLYIFITAFITTFPKIGGPGIVVEIDEDKFGIRKYVVSLLNVVSLFNSEDILNPKSFCLNLTKK